MSLRSLFFLAGLMAVSSAGAGERAIIVLDASGSMWGQIDGSAKIEIARETLSQVLQSVPGTSELGLLTYGHRVKGKCDDIELLVPPAAGTSQAIASAANGLKPKGKTPLSRSVRQAAEALKYTEERATVILITDGIETCNADPCALGNELEKFGVDFTAHVVGFGLSNEEGRQVACLAENTGGLYIQAGDAGELVDALTQTVVVEAPVEPAETATATPLPEATLSAPDTAPIAAVVSVGWTGPGDRYDRIEIFDPDARNGAGDVVRSRGVHSGDLDQRTVRLALPATPGQYQFRYYHGKQRAILTTTVIEVTPADVALLAPAEIAVGRTFKVEWIGPGGRYDVVQLFDPAARGGEGKMVRDKRLLNDDFDAKTVSMPAPAKPGDYELRYYNGQDKEVLATRALVVIEAPVRIEGPQSVEAAAKVTVDWIGPGGRYDSIQLWDPLARGGEGKMLHDKRLRNDDFDNQRASLPAPAKAGQYELRYWNGANKIVLATAPLAVVEAVVTLDAPDQIGQGRTIKVTWQGPGARYDAVQLFDPRAGGDGKVIHDKRLLNDDYDNNQASMPASHKPGQYELRYWNGDNKKVLARRPIQVVAIDIGLSAPSTVETGTKFVVEWQGPGGRYDSVQIFDPNARGGDGKVVAEKRLRNDAFENNRVTIKAPDKAGNFTLRYWNGDNKAVLAKQPIDIQ